MQWQEKNISSQCEIQDEAWEALFYFSRRGSRRHSTTHQPRLSSPQQELFTPPRPSPTVTGPLRPPPPPHTAAAAAAASSLQLINI